MTQPQHVQHDNYALDDTLAGRITQAAAVGIMTSFPDWVKGKAALGAAYTLSFLGFGALVAVTNAQHEQEEDQPERPTIEASGVKLWAIVVAAILLLIFGAWLDVKLSRALAARLRKAGVKKPWSALGAIYAALVFLVSELEARDIAKQAA